MKRRDFLIKSTFAAALLGLGDLPSVFGDALAAHTISNIWGMKPLGPDVPPLQWKPATIKRPLQSRLKIFPASGNPLILAQDSKPLASIIIADNADTSDKEAASVLQDGIQKISGAKLPIIAEKNIKATDKSTFISIGATDLAKKANIIADNLLADGYRLQTHEKVLFVVGNNQGAGMPANGTRNGAYALLERHLGYLQLWPGELGNVAPAQKTLTLPPVSEQDEPALPVRGMRNGYTIRRGQVDASNALALKRLQRSDAAFIKNAEPSEAWSDSVLLGKSATYSYGHTYLDYWEKYHKEHPDFFALQPNGTREQSATKPDRSRLDVSNPALIETIAANVIATFDANPDRASASISPNDGGPPGFCMCENCRRLDPPNAPKITANFGAGHGGDEYVSLSDRYVTFYAKIAEIVGKKYPDKLLGCYAYSAYQTPPLYAKLPTNVLVGFVGLSYFNEKQRQTNLQDWDLWTRSTEHLLLRPNALHGGHYFPSVFTHKIAADIKHCYQTGMMATDFDSIMHNWAGQGVNYYVLAKLLWDPSLNPDDLVREYCDKGFGVASPAVQKYFSALEKLTDEIADDPGDTENNEDAISNNSFYSLLSLLSRHYTDDRIDELQQLLDEAKTQADGDAKVLSRLTFLEQSLRFAKAEIHPVRLFIKMRTGAVPANDANTQKLLELLQERQRVFQDIFDNHFYAQNVVRILARETSMWESFGWEPDKM